MFPCPSGCWCWIRKVVRCHMERCSQEPWTRGTRKEAYRPTSKAGDAMGESSVEMVKMPSNLRSAKGAVTSAETRATTLSLREYN